MSENQRTEHEAWRQVCRQLLALGVDINQREPLAAAIKLWAAEYANLYEAEDAHRTVLFMRRSEYAPHTIQGAR